jgi:MoxR-like ATPase
VRATRDHSDLRVGSSVRGAIDLTLIAEQLAALRERAVTDDDLGLDAALAALSGRIRVREGSGRTPEAIVRELWESIPLETDDATTERDPGKA